MSTDYEVGYGKTPVHTRFKLGESGNKNGRPKGSKNINKALEEQLNKKIILTENGKPIRMSKGEAVAAQLVNKSVKGDIKSIGLLLNKVKEIESYHAEQEACRSTSNRNDDEILTLFLPAGLESLENEQNRGD